MIVYYQVECTELCPCRTLQQRARADRLKSSFLFLWRNLFLCGRYIFSLASNPFYLWLICTIFYEAGEGYVPTTLTQVLLLLLPLVEFIVIDIYLGIVIFLDALASLDFTLVSKRVTGS